MSLSPGRKNITYDTNEAGASNPAAELTATRLASADIEVYEDDSRAAVHLRLHDQQLPT